MLTIRAWIAAAALIFSLIAVGCSKSSSPDAGMGATSSTLKAYGLSASAGDSAATLSWPTINGAIAYNLYWSVGADISAANATKITGVTSPYSHAGLSNGTAYYYLFSAVTAAGESAPSTTVKVTPKLPRDGAPAKVSALAGDGRITLVWDAVPNATTYSVYWNTTGDVNLRDTQVAHVSYPAVHTGLTNGQQYYYIVTAETQQFGVVASAEVSTAPHIAVPSPPLSVSVSAGDQRASLSWPAVSDATAYALYWNNTGHVSLADHRIDVTTPNYTHSGLTNNTRYFYRVAALNAQGPSVLSAEVTAKPHIPAPGAPGNVTAAAGNEEITLNWDPVANASTYNLYWDTGAAATATATAIANVKSPFVHKPLTGGVAVNYVVTALRDGVESTGSAPISATPLGPLPSPPAGFNATPAKQQITLTWAAVDGALGYRVYWHTQDNPTETLIITGATPTPSYTHTGLLDNTTYFYRIEAITADGISPAATASETTLAATAPASTGPPPTPIDTTHTVGGAITGLISTSAGLVLTLTNDASEALVETLPITPGAIKDFKFTTALPSGGTYTVAVRTSPATPINQTCSVDTGSQTVTIGNANIASVAITCITNSFAVGGTISGLATGASVSLSLTAAGGKSQTVTVIGPSSTFTFGSLESGNLYTLTVAANPTSPNQICNFANGVSNTSGVVTKANTNDVVNCATSIDNWVTNGKVDAVALSADGKALFIGGQFSQVGPRTGSFVPIDTASGMPTGVYPKVDGFVRASIPDGKGGWYIGGIFSLVGTVPRNNLAHIFANGTVDTAWDPNANKTVDALTIFGGTVYVGGYFTAFGAQGQTPRNYLAALDAVTGIPTAWNPNLDLDRPGVSTLAVARDGATIYAGGGFRIQGVVGGQTPRNYLAALDAVTGIPTAWNPNPGDWVHVLVVTDTVVYVVSNSSVFDIPGYGQVSRGGGLAALDIVTGVPTAWDPQPDGPTNTLAVSGSTIYVGGSFSHIGGRYHNSLAALDATSGLSTTWDPNPNGLVNAIATSGTTVYVGGNFTALGAQGQTPRNSLAALDAVTGEPTSWNPNANSTINTLAVYGAAVYAGGEFTSLGGQMRNSLAALDAATGALTSWDPNVLGSVKALAVSGNTVYAGGYFFSIGGIARNSLAALDAITGAPTAWDPNAYGEVDTIVISRTGSTIYVGGSFTAFGVPGPGQIPRNYLAEIDATTGVPTAWDPNPNGTVSALAITDTVVYAGGSFTTLGGLGQTARNYLAALDIATGVPTNWNPNLYTNGGTVNALAISGATIYAGGSFTIYGADAQAIRYNLAALDMATGIPSSWNPKADNWVGSLVVSGTTVYAGGAFTTVGGQARNSLTALDTTSGLANNWNPNAYGTVNGNGVVYSTINAIVVSGNTLYAGGGFRSIGGEARNNIAFFPR